MKTSIPSNSPRVNSQNDLSIIALQDAELKRQRFLVARQEFMRMCDIEELPVFDSVEDEKFIQSCLDFEAEDVPAPRTCNTGALIAPLKIDWLEFTVKGVDPVSAVSSYLGLDWSLFAVQDFGMQGYPDSAIYGKVIVLWSETKPARGAKIILSSQALDQVKTDAIEVIRLVLADGGTFARIDGALDDRNEIVSIDTVFSAVRERQDVNRFTQVEIREPIDRRTGDFAGRSVYWGKPSSSRQVVIYEKSIEQFRKTGNDTGHWIRCECRWKKRAANIAAVKLGLLGLEALPGMIKGIIDFRLNDNSQTDRRTVCDWWSAWVGAAEPIKTGIGKVVKTIEEKASWLGRQVSKTMGQVAALMDGETILEMIRAGIHATTDREWKQLDPTGKRVIWSGSGQFDCITPF